MSVNGFCAFCGAEARAGASICATCGSRVEGFFDSAPLPNEGLPSGYSPYRLTWQDFYLLENLLRCCEGKKEHLAHVIRQRLTTATIIFEADAGPDLVTVDRWVVYRLESGETHARMLVPPRKGGDSALQLRLDNPHGLALLGLRVGMDGFAWHADGQAEQLRVLSVDPARHHGDGTGECTGSAFASQSAGGNLLPQFASNAPTTETVMIAPTGAASVQALEDEALLPPPAQEAAAEFRAIMQQHNRRLYRVARSILRDDTEAEDALQEAYLRAFSGLSRFRVEASLSTWLTRIVINEALARVRQRRTMPRVENLESLQMYGMETQIIPFPLTEATQPDPEQAAMLEDTRRSIEAAIDSLPEPFRVVFVMRAIEEMSVEETARCLDIREMTVKTRFHRAKRRLRKVLSTEFDSSQTDLFPFGGDRCARITDAVLVGLGLLRSNR